MKSRSATAWGVRVGLTVLVAVLAGQAQAALIVGSVNTSPPGTADLTAIGWLDWAYWNTATGSGHSGLPANEKAGGSMIGSAAAVGGGTLRGSTSTTWPATYFSYSDGTSPVSDGPIRYTGVFNTQLDTLNAGASLTVELPTVDPYFVYLWVANYNSTGQLSATMPGAVAYVDASGTHNTDMGGGKGMTLYTLMVTADNPGDLLTLDYRMVDQQYTNSHVVLVAAAVAAVPEPSALLLALLGVGLFACRAARTRATRRC